jgi:hypothetical protein
MSNPTNGKSRSPLVWLLGILLVGGVVFGVTSNSNTPAPVPAVTISQPQVQTQQPQPNISPDDSQDPNSDQPQTRAQRPKQNTLSNNNYYTNSDGNTLHSPAYSDSVPIGATAQCSDGTYSFSQHRQGTCSHHGGVEQWLN